MRVSKPPEERRAEILLTARRLFDEKGIEKTRISDIVRDIGVAQGVFYYYFPSKDALVAEVVAEVVAELDARRDAVLERDGPFTEKVAAYIELYIGFVDGFLADDETSTSPLLVGPYTHNELLVAGRRRLAEGWRRLCESGAPVRCPALMADVLLLGLEACSAEKLPGRREIAAVAEQALGLGEGSLAALYEKRA